MLRKKQRLDGKATNTNNAPTINHPSFQKPYTMSENLSGSVQAATKINNTLKSSLILLGSVTKEFNRQGYATQHERQYELATTLDIERVRQDLAKELKPEIDQSLDGVQLQLDALESQELDLQTDVDNQERLLRDIKAGNRTDTQQTRRLSRPTADELRDRKQKLMELIAEEDEQYTRVTEEVNKMKTTILKLERQMDAMEVDSSNEERAKEREKDLEHELAELEISANNKHEEVKKKQAENNKLPIVASQEAPIQITTEESKSQYTSLLQLFTSVAQQISQPEFIASTAIISSCDTHGKKYQQALQTEKKYIQTDEKEKQGQSMNTQIQQLCKSLISDHVASKTAIRVIELILTNGGLISIEQLLEEFPSTKEKRHNLTMVTLLLIQANILKISGTDLITTSIASTG